MRTLIVALCLFGLPSCVDFTGLESLDAYASDIAESLEVAAVVCQPSTLAVGESADCAAANAAGTQLKSGAQSMLIWESSDNSVAAIDLNGHLTAHAVGEAVVTGRGPNESSAVDTVTVQ